MYFAEYSAVVYTGKQSDITVVMDAVLRDTMLCHRRFEVVPMLDKRVRKMYKIFNEDCVHISAYCKVLVIVIGNAEVQNYPLPKASSFWPLMELVTSKYSDITVPVTGASPRPDRPDLTKYIKAMNRYFAKSCIIKFVCTKK